MKQKNTHKKTNKKGAIAKGTLKIDVIVVLIGNQPTISQFNCIIDNSNNDLFQLGRAGFLNLPFLFEPIAERICISMCL